MPLVTSNLFCWGGLPVHVHAGFALQDNRRGIWRNVSDTDGIHKMWAAWNEHILATAIPEVYAEVLTFLAVSWLPWGRERLTETFQDIGSSIDIP